MQTLVFNTTLKEVRLYQAEKHISPLLELFIEVPTVRVSDGFYEVMKKYDEDKNIPVLRVPISRTNMLIEK
jgi:hypothetical protein